MFEGGNTDGPDKLIAIVVFCRKLYACASARAVLRAASLITSNPLSFAFES